MSFSRYRKLLKLLQQSKPAADCNWAVNGRSYSKVIFSSSPHEVRIKPKRVVPERKQRIPKYNHKLQEDPKYQKELSFDEEDELMQFGQHKRIDNPKILTTLPDDSFRPQNEKDYVLEPKFDPNYEPSKSMTSIDENDDNFRTSTKLKTIETVEGPVTLNLSEDEFDVKEFMKELSDVSKPLDECNEDLSDVGPYFSPTFNFAAYADNSKLVQEYIKLGVKLYKVEKNLDHMRALLSVDLEKELPLYIQFLHDCGVPADCLGDVISENPMVLTEDLDDMKTRIRYLRAHEFARKSVARIITRNPTWLTWATKHIDERLGHFQNEFKLSGPEVRFLATKCPKLITYNIKHIHENTFAIREEMGFNKNEMKVILLSKPRLWMNNRKKINAAFDYLHNTMNLSHLVIASQAEVLTTRKSRIANRHEFLVELKKAQYDPTKPGYIAPKSIVVGSDEEFCSQIAKAAVDTYNMFLKTR